MTATFSYQYGNLYGWLLVYITMGTMAYWSNASVEMDLNGHYHWWIQKKELVIELLCCVIFLLRCIHGNINYECWF